MLRDILNRHLISSPVSASILEISQLMCDHDVGCVVMVDTKGSPIGLITDRDIVVRCLAAQKDIAVCRAEEVMTRAVEFCRETDGIFDCITKMRVARVRRMPVVDARGKAVGVISFGDLLGVLSKELVELTSTTTATQGSESLVA